MKRTIKLISLMLVLAMLAGLLPTVALRASADEPQTVYAHSAADIRHYLQNEVDYKVVLANAIDENVSSQEVWCSVVGEKILDLNGYNLTLHADTMLANYGLAGDSTMFRVEEGATFTVLDSSLMGSRIHYEGQIHTGTLRAWTQNRNIFRTNGRLILNHVCADAGRYKSEYNPNDMKDETVCIYGAAVRVGATGYLENNNSTLTGFCNPRTPEVTSTVYVKEGGKVRFNGGGAYAHAGGDVFRCENKQDDTLRVSAGTFYCDYYDTLMLESYYDVADIDRYGIVGLTAQDLAPEATHTTDASHNPIESCSYLTVYAQKKGGMYMRYMPNGETSTVIEPGETAKIPYHHATIYAIAPVMNYFETLTPDSPCGEDTVTYIWSFYDNNVLITDCVTDEPELDLSELTLNTGVVYKMRCVRHEQLGRKFRSFDNYAEYDSGYLFIRLVEALEVPSFSDHRTQYVTCAVGESASFTVQAEGDGVSYTWQINRNDGAGWGTAPNSADSSTYVTGGITEAWYGYSFRCKASNARGSAYSRRFILVRPSNRVDLTELDEPQQYELLSDRLPQASAGVTPTAVKWMRGRVDNGDMVYEELPEGFAAFANGAFYAQVTMEYDSEIVRKDYAEAYLTLKNGKEVKGTKVSATDEALVFRFRLEVDGSNVTPIDAVNLTRTSSGKAPGAPFQVGEQLGGVAVEDGVYTVGSSSDVRAKLTGFKWYVDGSESARTATVESGHLYKLEASLSIDTPYYLNDYSLILLDGLEMEQTRYDSVQKTVTAEIEFDLRDPEPAVYEDYDLWICGIRVNSGNKNDVMFNDVFTYEPALKELTIHWPANNDDGEILINSSDSVVKSEIPGLTIRLMDPMIFVSEKECISLSGDTVVKDVSASKAANLILEAECGETSLPHCAVYVTNGAALTLDHVKAQVWSTVEDAVKGCGEERLILKNSFLDAASCPEYDDPTGAVGAAVTGFKEIRAQGVKLESPEDGSFHTGTVLDASGTLSPYALFVADEAQDSPFEDAIKGKYYYDAMLWAYKHEPQIVNGLDETHFGPDATCTRGHIVTFLWRAKGCPEPASEENPFTDVANGKFYYKAVLWAVEQGITTGVTANEFRPNDPCNRGQAVTFLWRAEGKPEPFSSDNPFVDVEQGKYYYDAVLWAFYSKPQITNGIDATHFAPDNVCTRGQIVTFLYRDMAE